MNTSVSLRTIRIMLTAAVALTVAGLVAVVTDGGDSSDLAAGSTASTTSVAAVVADGGAETVPGPAEPTTAAPGGETTVPAEKASVSSTTAAPAPGPTTAAAPTTTAPPATAPSTGASATPTPAGTYLYDTDGTMTLGTNERQLPSETTLTVGEVAGDGRQVQVRDLRDDKGDGTVSRTTFRYAAEGVYLEQIELESNFSGFGQTNVLTATTPYLLIPADAGTGTVTTGRLEGGGIVADLTFTVVDAGPDTSDVRLVVDLSGDVTGRQTSDITARTADQLTMHERVDSDLNANGLAVKSNYEANLKG